MPFVDSKRLYSSASNHVNASELQRAWPPWPPQRKTTEMSPKVGNLATRQWSKTILCSHYGNTVLPWSCTSMTKSTLLLYQISVKLNGCTKVKLTREVNTTSLNSHCQMLHCIFFWIFFFLLSLSSRYT